VRIEAPVNGGRNYNGPKVAKSPFTDKFIIIISFFSETL